MEKTNKTNEQPATPEDERKNDQSDQKVKQPVADENLKNVKKSTAENEYDEVVRNFDEVLDGDETIKKAYKPNKEKVYFANVLSIGVPFLFLVLFSFAVFLIPSEDVVTKSEVIIGTCVPVGLMVLFVALGLWFAHLFYKHTYYVVTNKRILIRTGIFGVDYKSLDLKSVGASDVSVSLFDKILRKNTGTLRFGSNSSPIVNKATSYCFAHIVDPYKTYKEIKELIDEAQKEE